MWWPAWITLTVALMFLAYQREASPVFWGLCVVFAGLLAARVAVQTSFPHVAMMAVWTVAGVLLLTKLKLYGMAFFAFMAAAAYFPLWVSYRAGDIMGLLMLLVSIGGIYDFAASPRFERFAPLARFIFAVGSVPAWGRDRSASMDHEQ